MEEVVEEKPSFSFHCIICTKSQEHINKNNFIEDESVFNLVCKSLKIKLSKKYSWNFNKDFLPFCTSCTDASKGLLLIEEQIQTLQIHFQEKVQELRNLIVDSNNRRFTTDDTTQLLNSEDDERFVHFRRQVIGTATLERKSSRRQSAKNTKQADNVPTVPPKSRLKKNLIVNALEEDGEEEEENKFIISDSRRKSKRTSLRVIVPENFESDDQDQERTELDDDFTPDLSNDEVLEKSNLDESTQNYTNVDLTDLKLEIHIKEEPLESEVEEVDNFEDEAIHTKRSNPSTSNIELSPKMKSRPQKRKCKISPPKRKQESSEDEEDVYDSDFRMENSGSDNETSDDEFEKVKYDTSIYRKWRNDRKTGKMWYDGVEVISVKNGLKCSKCNHVIEGDKKQKHKIKVKRHIVFKHLEKFACVLCDKILSCKKYLDMHVKMVHEKSVIIPCNICEKPFTSQNAMRRHAWNHQNEKEKQEAIAAGRKQYGLKKIETLQCGTCGKMCKGPYNLKRHEETHIDQKDRMKHMCQICGGLYSAPETLRSHIKLVHENNNQLQWLKCPHCPKKYPQPGRLEKHLRSHTGEKPFVCSECGLKFSQLTLLKVHMLKHKNLRPHKCEHCDMSFFRRYHMQRHTQIYHESKTPPTKKQPYRSENGTRKIPQKRERKTAQKINLLKPDETNAREIVDPLQQSNCETVDPQQIIGIVGALDEAPPNFSFTNSSNSCTYPFTYAFASGGIHHQ